MAMRSKGAVRSDYPNSEKHSSRGKASTLPSMPQRLVIVRRSVTEVKVAKS